MNRYLAIAAVIFLSLVYSSCSKRKVHYECQCYKADTLSNSYEIGPAPGHQVAVRCYEIQRLNGEDTCYGSGRLK